MITSVSIVWVLVFALVQLCITFLNLLQIRRFGDSDSEPNPDLPFVSILIPARNEESNIGPCVESLLAQEYPNYEVIVLDDNSQDCTAKILEQLIEAQPKLTVLQGQPLPADWYGKHWACWQLAEKAKGDWILFTDADTVHHPDMLRDVAPLACEEELDLLSAFVYQRMETWGERLTVPFPFWSILTICPIILGRKWKWSVFSAVNGQFMLFRRAAYEAIGGHQAVRRHAADDVALGRRLLKHGYRWAIHDASKRVSCRMYQSFAAAWEGFTKNYYALFDYQLVVATFVWLWMGFVAWWPLLLLVFRPAGLATTSWDLAVAIAAVAVNTGLWTLTVLRFSMPKTVILMYPFVVAIATMIGLVSIVRTLTGTATWKGRRLFRPSERNED